MQPRQLPNPSLARAARTAFPCAESGPDIGIRAGIDAVGGSSDHADQADLVGYVTGMKHWPKEIRLIHGEGQAKQRLAEVLRMHYQNAGKDSEISVS